jgi:hypothetical protein
VTVLNCGRGARDGVLVGGLLLALLGGCAAAVLPLTGRPTEERLVAPTVERRPHLIRFGWRYADETFEASGDGVVRVQAPDRARLDFFLQNGMAGGWAILIGDSLTIPGIDLVRRLLPPPPLLWAALGRLTLPASADTIVRRDADTLRAALIAGGGTAAADEWRVAMVRGAITQVDRLEGQRLVETLAARRASTGGIEVQYVHLKGKRRLTIAVRDTTFVEGFDDAIWRRR